MATRHRFEVDGAPHSVVVDETGGRVRVTVDDGDATLVDATTEGVPGQFSLVIGGRPTRAYVVRSGQDYRVIVDGRSFLLRPAGASGRGRGSAGGHADPPGQVTAPLAGVVVDIRVQVGDVIEAGQTLVVVEAMKMQNEVQTPLAGTVTAIRVQVGVRAEKGDILVEYTPAPEE